MEVITIQILERTIKNMILDSKKFCKYCSKEKKSLEIEIAGIKRTVYPNCNCESDAYEKEKEMDKQKEKKRRIEIITKQSRLGTRFKQCTFDNFKIREGTENAYNTTLDYVTNFNSYKQTGKGLLLTGIAGTGKTHLVASITNYLLEELVSVVFVVVPDLLQDIRSTYNYNGEEVESKIMYGLNECDLLILDDIGVEKKSDWTTEKIFTIINTRYSNQKPIIYTTNCNSNELEERIGNRAFSRIIETSKIIKFTCDDYRLKELIK